MIPPPKKDPAAEGEEGAHENRGPLTLDLNRPYRKLLRDSLSSTLKDIETDLASGFKMRKRAQAEREADIYRRLIAALDGGSIIPNREVIRVVEKMGKQSDVANEYEQTMLEHDAFAAVLVRLR